MKNDNKNIAYFFIVLSLLITVILLLITLDDGYTFWNSPVEYDVTGQIGDFIGGVVGTIISAAGFYFLYLTFNEQRSSFEKERLESKFFDLVKLHRDNVNELRFDGKELVENYDSLFIDKTIYEGKSVFKVIFNQFVICKNELGPFFRRDKIYLPDYEKELLNDIYIIENKINLTTLAKVDICYSIVFYGVSSEGLLILENLFSQKYKPKFINDILRFISLKPAYDKDILEKWAVLSNRKTRGKRTEIVTQIYDWRKTKKLDDDFQFAETIRDYHNRYIKYYGGHQFRLGHYFRHLYQTVKFINNHDNIDYQTKYEYVKILRSQLSTYEQAILFTNSLSQMGKSWELQPKINSQLKKYKKYDFELITKYNLIKNLPGESIYGFPFKEFFRDIEYENDNVRKERKNYH
ncbi:putative phage abortive infection protein [Flavobacterium sp. XS2P14]|uniref:putative phage abortive infection protein n=2 Tax=Flavobacterium TaxID=237 RepID=UPI003AAB787B